MYLSDIQDPKLRALILKVHGENEAWEQSEAKRKADREAEVQRQEAAAAKEKRDLIEARRVDREWSCSRSSASSFGPSSSSHGFGASSVQYLPGSRLGSYPAAAYPSASFAYGAAAAPQTYSAHRSDPAAPVRGGGWFRDDRQTHMNPAEARTLSCYVTRPVRDEAAEVLYMTQGGKGTPYVIQGKDRQRLQQIKHARGPNAPGDPFGYDGTIPNNPYQKNYNQDEEALGVIDAAKKKYKL